MKCQHSNKLLIKNKSKHAIISCILCYSYCHHLKNNDLLQDVCSNFSCVLAGSSDGAKLKLYAQAFKHHLGKWK